MSACFNCTYSKDGVLMILCEDCFAKTFEQRKRREREQKEIAKNNALMNLEATKRWLEEQ